MTTNLVKQKITALRQKGKTVNEIAKETGCPKSTSAYWCRKIFLSKSARAKLSQTTRINLTMARKKALQKNKEKQEIILGNIKKENLYLKKILTNKDTTKIALAMLFLGEGVKNTKGSLVFGNSDPKIIALFLKLLKKCFPIDNQKFRCTLQCRADQKILTLERFWSKITHVPLRQFYQARIDTRSKGIKTTKKEYKGVCRIDYLSAKIYHELKIISEILIMGL